MDEKETEAVRQRLTTEYEVLIKSINRNRAATEEIRVENTEDEGDLATISHDKHLLSNLDQSAFTRLKFIKEAINALDRDRYGECLRCGEDINKKRLLAVPWATFCIRCQEENEVEHLSWQMAATGSEEVMDF